MSENQRWKEELVRQYCEMFGEPSQIPAEAYEHFMLIIEALQTWRAEEEARFLRIESEVAFVREAMTEQLLRESRQRLERDLRQEYAELPEKIAAMSSEVHAKLQKEREERAKTSKHFSFTPEEVDRLLAEKKEKS